MVVFLFLLYWTFFHEYVTFDFLYLFKNISLISNGLLPYMELGTYLAHFARGIGTMAENWHTTYYHVCLSFRFVEAYFSYIQIVYVHCRLEGCALGISPSMTIKRKVEV